MGRKYFGQQGAVGSNSTTMEYKLSRHRAVKSQKRQMAQPENTIRFDQVKPVKQ